MHHLVYCISPQQWIWLWVNIYVGHIKKEANRWRSRRMFEEEENKSRVKGFFCLFVYVTVKRGKEKKVTKTVKKNDEDWEGLKELICSSDCVRGQGETRVTLISLPPYSHPSIPLLFISLNLLLGIWCLIYLILTFTWVKEALNIFIFGSCTTVSCKAQLLPALWVHILHFITVGWLTAALASPESWKSHPLSPFCSTDTILGPEEFRGVANFSTFLLDRSSGMLFLGARDAILAVDTNKLNQKPRMVGRMRVFLCVCWVTGHYICHIILSTTSSCKNCSTTHF